MKLRERILPCRYCGIVPDIWKTLCCILLPGTIQLLDSELQSITRFSYNEKNCFYTTLFKITIGVKIWGLREQATSFSSK